MMKLKTELKWLHSYLDAVSDLVPLQKLGEIKFLRYRNTRPSYHGLIETKSHRKYKITIRVYDKPSIPISKLDQETVLSHLSHELSHLVYFEDYIVQRFHLEAQIYLRFAELLQNLGYEQERNKC